MYRSRSRVVRARPRRAGAARSFAAGVGLVLLVGLLPSSAGASLPRTLTAPYSGSSVHAGRTLESYCGGAGGLRARWNATTGDVRGSSRASFRSCAYAGPGTLALNEALHAANVSIPFTVSTAGRYNLTERFNWTAAAALSLTPGKCRPAGNFPYGYDYNSCVWYLQWYVYVDTYLWDRTTLTVASPVDNGYWVSNYTEVYDDNYCSYGSCGGTTSTSNGTGVYNYGFQAPGSDYVDVYVPAGPTSGSGSLWTNSTSWNAATHRGTNVTLRPSDSYDLVTSVYFIAFADAYGYANIYTGSVHIYPQFDLSGSGRGSVTGSVTVTSVGITQVV